MSLASSSHWTGGWAQARPCARGLEWVRRLQKSKTPAALFHVGGPTPREGGTRPQYNSQALKCCSGAAGQHRLLLVYRLILSPPTYFQ